jgi:hypothetical protein
VHNFERYVFPCNICITGGQRRWLHWLCGCMNCGRAEEIEDILSIDF